MARDPSTIQQEIEQARDALASTLDQLSDRASPKSVAGRTKNKVVAALRSPAGLAGVGVAVSLVAVLVVRRVRG